MQILGGLGITDDTIVARLFRGAPLPHLRQPLRGASLVDRPACAAGWNDIMTPTAGPSH
jgi:alkylation response protein AidB-like acyl-CoA dehydrogenase